MKPTFFKTQADFREWLINNHETKTELLVGYYKKGLGIESMDWPQSVDEALCFGWIDGVRKGIDEKSYSIRFTPRKPNSIWSNRNMGIIQRLMETKQMYPAGISIYESRKEENIGVYAFEKENVAFTADQLKQFESNPEAWFFFNTQSKTYIKSATNWVITAKQEATRKKRLDELIQCSVNQIRLKQFTPNKK